MLNNPTDNLEPEITFLSETPEINGVLDPSLNSLPIRKFNAIFKENKSPITQISYRMAYGINFLYLYIEADAEHLYFRDRAYQNGDGFVMLIAKPKPNHEPADEFYELACSAVNDPQLEWCRKIFWNYNVDKLFVPTSDQTILKFHEGQGKISFELLLPWDDVRPYHPWNSEGIGFNLSFCKGVEPNNSVWYTLLDGHTGSEFSKREYTTLKFQKPVLQGNPQTYVSFQHGHITEDDSLKLTALTVSNDQSTENIEVSVLSGEGNMLINEYLSYPLDKGITIKDFSIPLTHLKEGGYQLNWQSEHKNYHSFAGLTVLPQFNVDSYFKKLELFKSKISQGTYHTTLFTIQDIQSKINKLKIYERSYNERMGLTKLNQMFLSFEKGVDPLIEKIGFTRKAYLSKVDNTLQPYVVYLPKEYEKNKKYPLMIFLHGSASDETNIIGFRSLIPEGYIGLGVFGRGQSNGFTRDHSQEDIAEAIEAVEEDYSIDYSKILLTGFSMGGYGVYRTFYETPNKFKAIAVFSGEVTLQECAPGQTAIDFADIKNLKVFKGLPVFIFHGENDLNVSLPDVKSLSKNLKKVGAQVEFVIEPNKGHDEPGQESLNLYYKWVENNMK